MYKRQAHTPSTAKRVVRIGIGVILLLGGAVMIVTPGPALILIPAGLMTIASVHPPLHHWMSVRKRWLLKKWRAWRAGRRAASAARSR